MTELDKGINALLLLSNSMNVMHLEMAIELAKGATQEDAYRKAGGKGKDGRARASELIRTNPNILKYVELSKEIAIKLAQKDLNYDEKDWLRDTLHGLSIAMGKTEVVETVYTESEDGSFSSEERRYKQVNLSAIARFTDQLGKKLGLFSEKKKIEHEPRLTLAELMAGAADEGYG